MSCCTVNLNKTADYWFKEDGEIDREKMANLGQDLRYQELM